MRTELFDFELPRERIALRPIHPRDAARLLVFRPGLPLEDRHVRELPHLLRPGDRLVLNDTKVIPARLNGRLLKGAEPRIEASHAAAGMLAACAEAEPGEEALVALNRASQLMWPAFAEEHHGLRADGSTRRPGRLSR